MRWRGSTANREGPQTGVTTSQRRTSLWLLQSTASSAMAAIAEDREGCREDTGTALVAAARERQKPALGRFLATYN